MNESVIIQKLIQVGQMLERGELEYSGAEADIKHYFEQYAALRIYAVSRRSEQLFCTSKAHNFSLSKIGICLECKSKEPVGAK